MTQIIHAHTKAHYQSAHELFIQYADSLGFDLEFRGTGSLKEERNAHFSNRCYGIKSCDR